MYKKHVIITLIIMITTSVICFVFSLDCQFISGVVIDITAIASAVYLAIYPLLQGSDNLVQKLSKQDKTLPKKSQMGVLNTYLKTGLIMGIISIVWGCLNLLILGSYPDIATTQLFLYRFYSAISIGQFSGNFPLLWFIGEFMVFRVAFNK